MAKNNAEYVGTCEVCTYKIYKGRAGRYNGHAQFCKNYGRKKTRY
jgi:hypothetical protein